MPRMCPFCTSQAGRNYPEFQDLVGFSLAKGNVAHELLFLQRIWRVGFFVVVVVVLKTLLVS